jgi:hypothetical protein
MRSTKQRLVTGVGLALALIAVTGPVLAQKQPGGKSGTGGAAGYSPPMDATVGGAARGMNAPPASDDAIAPDPDRITPTPDESKQDKELPATDDKGK